MADGFSSSDESIVPQGPLSVVLSSKEEAHVIPCLFYSITDPNSKQYQSAVQNALDNGVKKYQIDNRVLQTRQVIENDNHVYQPAVPSDGGTRSIHDNSILFQKKIALGEVAIFRKIMDEDKISCIPPLCLLSNNFSNKVFDNAFAKLCKDTSYPPLMILSGVWFEAVS